MDDEEEEDFPPTVIVDVGNRELRCGWAGEEGPDEVLPGLRGEPSTLIVRLREAFEALDVPPDETALLLSERAGTSASEREATVAAVFAELRVRACLSQCRLTRFRTTKQLISKLPNTLCIQLKRFIFTDRLIKKKEYVSFDEVLKIPDSIVTSSLRLGIFNENS